MDSSASAERALLEFWLRSSLSEWDLLHYMIARLEAICIGGEHTNHNEITAYKMKI